MFNERKSPRFFLLIVILGLGLGGKCGSQTPPEYQRIFDLPRDRQKEEFKKLSFEKQIEIYHYAMVQEPPDKAYASFLASNGKEIIPALLKRLEVEKEDYARCDLIYVFKVMHQEYSNLRDEGELIAKLKQESQRINDGFWRGESEEYIQTIVRQPGAKRK